MTSLPIALVLLSAVFHSGWNSSEWVEHISGGPSRMLDPAQLAAQEGLFCQPESATTLATLKKLVRTGRSGGEGEDVLVLTGSGLKAPAVLEGAPISVHRVPVEGLEAGLARLL